MVFVLAIIVRVPLIYIFRLLFSGSLLGNLIYRQYGPRLTLMTGGILCGTGLIIWALLKSLFSLYLGVGLFVGLGFSFVILVGNATLSRYFKKRRPQGMDKRNF